MSKADATNRPANWLRAQQGIEQPYFDVRRGCQRQQQLIRARGVEVIDQQPHADSALRRLFEGAQEQPARAVVLDHVVLHIERVLGTTGKFQPRIQ